MIYDDFGRPIYCCKDPTDLSKTIQRSSSASQKHSDVQYTRLSFVNLKIKPFKCWSMPILISQSFPPHHNNITATAKSAGAAKDPLAQKIQNANDFSPATSSFVRSRIHSRPRLAVSTFRPPSRNSIISRQQQPPRAHSPHRNGPQ